MDSKTGALVDADLATIKSMESKLNTKFVPVPKDKVERVRAMSMSARKTWARQQEKLIAHRRLQRKARKAMQRKQRRRK